MMEMNVCRIINAHIQSGRIANPTERKMQDSANDYYSAGLYRAMFRNETDLNKLDYNYADHILEYPSEYPEYEKMLENAIKQDEKEDEV